MKKPVNLAFVERPSLEDDREYNFCRIGDKHVESIKTKEKYEFTRVYEVDNIETSIKKELQEEYIRKTVSGQNRIILTNQRLLHYAI